jgi:hypothetical protein
VTNRSLLIGVRERAADGQQDAFHGGAIHNGSQEDREEIDQEEVHTEDGGQEEEVTGLTRLAGFFGPAVRSGFFPRSGSSLVFWAADSSKQRDRPAVELMIVSRPA